MKQVIETYALASKIVSITTDNASPIILAMDQLIPELFLEKKKPMSPQLARWAIMLNEYDLTIEYVKGKLHADVDCLSRNAINEHDHITERAIIFICMILPTDINEWTNKYLNSVEAQALLDKALQNDSVKTIDGVIYTNDDKLYIPSSLRKEFMFRAHDDVAMVVERRPSINYLKTIGGLQ